VFYRILIKQSYRSLKQVATAGVVAAGCLMAGGPAWSFDTGPHMNITRDALSSEGFSETALQIAQMNNWFVDMYEKAPSIPYSGHTPWWKTALGAFDPLDPLALFGVMEIEDWDDRMVHAADATHFDSTNGGFPNALALNGEWERLQRAVYTVAREARDRNEPLKLLTVLGASLHQVQDFYSHTNWVEPVGGPGQAYDGPGWAANGYGSAPTWFDIPASVRNAAHVYGSDNGVSRRNHGHWRSDGNAGLQTGMNKDWSGRPYYTEAYIAAYWATRQWVKAVRLALNDDAFWERVMFYANRNGSDLDYEIKGGFEMSFYTGHWDGQGEPAGGDQPGPGGSLDDARSVTKDYFSSRGKTGFRRMFESLIERVADPNAAGPLMVVPSSQPLQQTRHFIKVQIDEMAQIDNLDLDYVVVQDRADFYVKTEIAGQQFHSPMIHGYDTYNFPSPNYPFVFLKALPRTNFFVEPLCNMQIEVTTGGDLFSGTNDNVYLRINDTKRFKLDKPLYDDFEKGDRDTYSLPLDNEQLKIGDIQYLQIEKSRDGVSGGWKLAGIKVTANGNLIYYNPGINKWLENNTLTWRAPIYTPFSPSTREVPIRMQMFDADSFLYFGDDHCDLHPDHDRYDLRLLFDPLPMTIRGDATGQYWAQSAGGDRHGGRLDDDDRARIKFQVQTITPLVIGQKPPPVIIN
jgi:hypothetical protein